MARIFVAIPISNPLQNVILEWQRSHSDLPVRWTKAKNLHVTLVPPWEEQNIQSVVSTLRQVAGSSFNMVFHTVSLGPNDREPWLIWARGDMGTTIYNLHVTINKVLQKPGEHTKLFTPHITLARFRADNFKQFPIPHLCEPVSWQEQVESFVLMQTHRTSEGSDYEVLSTFPLQSRA